MGGAGCCGDTRHEREPGGGSEVGLRVVFRASTDPRVLHAEAVVFRVVVDHAGVNGHNTHPAEAMVFSRRNGCLQERSHGLLVELRSGGAVEQGWPRCTPLPAGSRRRPPAGTARPSQPRPRRRAVTGGIRAEHTATAGAPQTKLKTFPVHRAARSATSPRGTSPRRSRRSRCEACRPRPPRRR